MPRGGGGGVMLLSEGLIGEYIIGLVQRKVKHLSQVHYKEFVNRHFKNCLSFIKNIKILEF